jgi:hypothetical protein
MIKKRLQKGGAMVAVSPVVGPSIKKWMKERLNAQPVA